MLFTDQIIEDRIDSRFSIDFFFFSILYCEPSYDTVSTWTTIRSFAPMLAQYIALLASIFNRCVV